jgi:hypothetical protein
MPVGLVLVAMAAGFPTGALGDDEAPAEKTRLGEDLPEFGVEIPFCRRQGLGLEHVYLLLFWLPCKYSDFQLKSTRNLNANLLEAQQGG